MNFLGAESPHYCRNKSSVLGVDFAGGGALGFWRPLSVSLLRCGLGGALYEFAFAPLFAHVLGHSQR